jgi:microcystin-dependent protein
MPYIVNFTDRENKTPITVFDNTSNEDTSLSFPGRNVTGYGRIIAENFLALLENFSGGNAPANPVEGQLWYDSLNGILQIWDNTQWKAASNIQRSNVEPQVEESKVGELWVDTTNQQLYVFSGTNWILVGPSFSTGLRSGPVVESVIDSDNIDRVILSFYVEDRPVVIISKDTFTPKNAINGYPQVRTGINITSENVSDGDLFPKFYGTAISAEALVVGGTLVDSSRFLRSDTVNTTDQPFNIRNNAGLTLGVDGTFSITATSGSARIYNASPGSSIDLQTNRGGIPDTVLRIIDDKVGINQSSPDEALDVNGNVKLNGSLILTNVAESTNLNNGSFRTAGGLAVTKNVIVGQTLDVQGITTTSTIEPRETDRHDLGSLSRRWNTVRAKTIVADTIVGPLQGNIIGNSTTSTNLRFPTNFRMVGDVTSPTITFDGQVGGLEKVFQTTLTAGLISSKSEPTPNRSRPDDFILTFREGIGLQKQRRDVFISDLGVPIGTLLPYAGATIPYGYLLCDGGEVEIAKFRDLYNVIGDLYGTPQLGAPGLTFVLPDLRGRFPLGRTIMDNGNLVPVSGGFVDAGGGALTPPRVGGGQAQNLGGSAGSDQNTLGISNVPDHEHTLKGTSAGSTNQYYAIRPDTLSPTEGGGAFLGRGGTTPGQFQYLPTSGLIDVPPGTPLGTPFSVMNPYLTLNYIIRSGPAAF